ncbi:MAG: snoRNA-binding rRNA-processing protein, partial [Pleopsidium flavum]
MPKATTPTSPGLRQARRHNPLSDDLVASGPVRTKSGKRKSRRDEVEKDSYVDAKSSRRILKIGQDLVEEERAEHPIPAPNAAFAFESRLGGRVDTDDEQHNRDDEDDWGDEDEEIVEEI